MPTKRRRQATAGPKTEAQEVREVLSWLERRGSKRNVDGMARYGIVARNVRGVSVGDLRDLGKQLGRRHDLALALWKTDVYEARMLTPFIADPAKVTPALMDRWTKDFDNWAITDALCFHLFDKTPHAWTKVKRWATRKPEFERRAAFALLASIALHDKQAGDANFLMGLKLIEEAATDERNFVKKGVNWALRGIGKRNPRLRKEAMKVAKRLAESDSPAARWCGKDALRELNRRSK
jgi:3-methyladenine DNA glycosylase AlkD